jgi:hypothetical protein
MNTKVRRSAKEKAALREDWQQAVSRLKQQVQEWSQAQGWPVTETSRSVTEWSTGTYEVPILEIVTPKGRVILEPIAHDVVEGEGRVDLYAWPTHYRVMLLQTDAKNWIVRTDSGINWPQLQRLISIQDEFVAVRAAVGILARSWPEFRGTPEVGNVRFTHVREAERNLEITYFVRLFTTFEGILGEHLTITQPGRRLPRLAEHLINRVALRERVPVTLRDLAHTVREYRNTIVHPRAALAPALSFPQALARLNRFLVALPDPP